MIIIVRSSSTIIILPFLSGSALRSFTFRPTATFTVILFLSLCFASLPYPLMWSVFCLMDLLVSRKALY
jgi:hypothetical protein